MPLFLSHDELQTILAGQNREPLSRFVAALTSRVRRRAEQPGLCGPDTTTAWWYVVAEYLTDAAMVWAISKDQAVGRWLARETMEVVRRSEDDWIGPFYRDHACTPRIGHLETAHMAWGVAAVLDLAGQLFTPAERDEIANVLTERAIPLCIRWLEANPHLANWRCIMTAGVAVPAAVLNEKQYMERAAAEFRLSTEIFQPDGSYAESVQYANYAIIGLSHCWEALVRRDPSLAAALPLDAYVRTIRWFAASHLYNKPLPGWGDAPRARAANFNDAAAVFRPSGDVLLHVATRAKLAMPKEAGLARWLFDEVYPLNADQGPWDRMTFGLVNHFGFLTLPLLPQAAAPIAPQSAGLAPLAAFSNGDALARDAWPGRTVLAVRTGSDPLCGPGHLHGDLNSLILVHNQERLLVDPGHSCYRNLIHELEGSTLTHNTCTFHVGAGDGRPLRHEEQMLPGVRQQERRLMRRHHDDRPEPPVERGAKRLLAAQDGPVTVIASEAARLYGPPLDEFTRIWLLAGPHMLWIVDRIRSSSPVKTVWNWLLNNRDGKLEMPVQEPGRLVGLRPRAGIALFAPDGTTLSGPLYAFVHDAYHTLPAQVGEGRPGSGFLMRCQEPRALAERVAVHAIAVDDVENVQQWRLRCEDAALHLDGPAGQPSTSISIVDKPFAIQLRDSSGRAWRVVEAASGDWSLNAE